MVDEPRYRVGPRRRDDGSIGVEHCEHAPVAGRGLDASDGAARTKRLGVGEHRAGRPCGAARLVVGDRCCERLAVAIEDERTDNVFGDVEELAEGLIAGHGGNILRR